MEAVRAIAAEVASRHSTVMILGETGSGKEMIARYIHAASYRATGPFVPVDCTTFSEGLFESEMFGHARGAFTGAIRDSLGIVRSASGGTLFLDELGELSLAMQAKLLRVLQNRRVSPVGDSKSYPVDIRVLCATNRDLSAMVQAGTFRKDLYYRLNVVVVHVPPLRARTDDVADLGRHFLQMQADLYEEPVKRLLPPVIDALKRYAWPGNVRELANVIEHAHVLSHGNVIELADLPPRLQQIADGASRAVRSVHGLHLETIERDAIIEALRRTNFNKAAASRMLGINIQRLNRRIRSLNVSLKP
jgi:transcriptional regulator with PAS, ATPase and Fis domain